MVAAGWLRARRGAWRRARRSTAASLSRRWSEDGQSDIYAIVTDDMSAYGVRASRSVPAAPSRSPTSRSCCGPRHSAASCAVAISGDDSHPSEVYSASVVGGKLKFQPLTHQNDALLLGAAARDDEEVSAKSKDGTGGPRAADEAAPATSPARRFRCCCGSTAGRTARISTAFAFERQWFAANGYAVLAVNYRGSAGRGAKYSRVDLGRLGALRGGRSAGDGRSGREDGRRRSEQARRRRLELRRHPHRLHDRQRQPVQGGDQRRRHRVHRRLLRHGPAHHPVRLRDRSAVGSRRRGRPTRRSHIRSCTPIGSRRRRSSSAARRTSTCRCRAGSRCTRRCAASASTRSS